MKNIILKILISFRDAIFPGRCLACDALYRKRSRSDSNPELIPAIDTAWNEEKQLDRFTSLMHPYLCPDCIGDYTPVVSPLCTKCGMIFQETIAEDHLCGDCIKKPGPFRMLRSAGIYNESLLSLIRAYKFKKKLQLAKPLSLILFMLFRHLYQNDDNQVPDLIIPVPLHKKRFRHRKFNQVWLLIMGWRKTSAAFNSPLVSQIRNDILIKQKMTIPQTGLDRKKRRTNIKGAFLVKNPEIVTGKKVLLVDDVYTTGATVTECTKVLLKAGADSVDVLTLARTQVI